MSSAPSIIGSFVVEKWPQGQFNGNGHHIETLEKVTIKSASYSSNLTAEACALQALSGGIGMPALHWFGTACGQRMMVTDSPGHSLDEVFHKVGRYFELQILLEFAHQLVFRLEWMHTRHVSHGNLEPASLNLGSSSWQSPQITISNFGNADFSGFSAQKDLEDVANILLYFATANSSWEEFKSRKKNELEIPSFLMEFFAAISSPNINPTDYAIIRKNLYTTRSLLKRTVFGGFSDSAASQLSLRHLSGKTTGDLFELLGAQMSRAGETIGCMRSQWTQEQAGRIVESIDDMMVLFFVLLMRDRPSRTRRRYLMGAYHLPNRLWRDLRWYLCMASCGSLPFQRLVTLRIYRYIGVLLEVVPIYDRYWTGYLSDLALSQMTLDPEAAAGWRQAWIYWKNRVNMLKRFADM